MIVRVKTTGGKGTGMKTAGCRKNEEASREVEAVDPGNVEETVERLHVTAQRLHPKVAWERMSEEAVRCALGLAPQSCPQRGEYEAGRQARAAGEAPEPGASMAFRTGWSHGKPPRARRRRWRPRQAANKPAVNKPAVNKPAVNKKVQGRQA